MTERDLFEAVLELPAKDRASYLDGVCEKDAALRQRLEALLCKHDLAGSFLEYPAAAPPSDPSEGDLGLRGNATVDEPPFTERPGTVIGPYKLLEQIGEGGFGVVFMAEQQQPIRRKVALKVIKPGMDTRQVIARFEAERQALALMDHPNIAKVLDAGTIGERDRGSAPSSPGADATGPARPYFVMELVRGLPITGYCDQTSLPIREQLELFLHVCHAVQHAHQKGIIHRDIKPTNVLVTLLDGVPVPKIIDFGIAKALGQQLTDKTLFTNFAQLVGTPLYMSPEQAELSALDVDTRSDIYSLGVLLYELLTGTTPFDKERLKTAGYDEMRRIIREEEPPKPSTRLRKDESRWMKDETKGTKRTSWGWSSHFSSFLPHPSSFQELDWIVMKCLEKDRNRRYESANSLALDIERYLNDEPVQACPPSVWYQFRKFARRRRGILASGGMVLFVLVALSTSGWLVRDRTLREAATDQAAEKALQEAIELQEKGSWPQALDATKLAEGILAGGGSESLRQRVHERREDLEMVLRLEDIRIPPLERNIQSFYPSGIDDSAYARAFREFGIDVENLKPVEAAARIRARSIWLELAVALDNWADCRQASGETDDSGWKKLVATAKIVDPDPWRVLIRDALERHDHQSLRRLAATVNIRELSLPSLISLLVHRAGMDASVERHLLLQAQREHPQDYWINYQLGWGFAHWPAPLHDSDQAIRFYTAALIIRPGHAPAHCHLANQLGERGRFDEAIAEYEKALEQNPNYAEGCNSLAWLLATCPQVELRNPPRAVEMAARGVELSPRSAHARNTLGVARYRAGNWKAAIQTLEQAEELAPGTYFAFNAFFLAMAHWGLSEKEKAHKEYEQAVAWMEKHHPKNEELLRFRSEAEQLMKK